MASRQDRLIEIMALNNNFPFGMLASSIALVASALAKCAKGDAGCEGEGEAFTLAMAILLTIALIAYIYHVYNVILSERGETFAAVTLFVAFTVIAGYATFEGPFEEAGNGFIAAWIGFIAATGNLVYNVKTADDMKERFIAQGVPLCILFVASVVVLVAAIADGCCGNQDVLGIVTSTVSISFTLVRFYVGMSINMIFSYFMAVWWMILGLILTFGLFDVIGNGYIATWAAMITSVYMASFSSNMKRRESLEFMKASEINAGPHPSDGPSMNEVLSP